MWEGDGRCGEGREGVRKGERVWRGEGGCIEVREGVRSEGKV